MTVSREVAQPARQSAGESVVAGCDAGRAAAREPRAGDSARRGGLDEASSSSKARRVACEKALLEEDCSLSLSLSLSRARVLYDERRETARCCEGAPSWAARR